MKLIEKIINKFIYNINTYGGYEPGVYNMTDKYFKEILNYDKKVIKEFLNSFYYNLAYRIYLSDILFCLNHIDFEVIKNLKLENFIHDFIKLIIKDSNNIEELDNIIRIFESWEWKSKSKTLLTINSDHLFLIKYRDQIYKELNST